MAAPASVTVAYLMAWRVVGGLATADLAAPFIGATTGERLAVALPAVFRAATLLVWPAGLSADYGPPRRPGFRRGGFDRDPHAQATGDTVRAAAPADTLQQPPRRR